jgi:hypothetical protein
VSTPIPPEKAFIVSVHLRDFPFHELRLRDAVVHTGFHPNGDVSVLDLEDDPRFFFPSGFNAFISMSGAPAWTRLPMSREQDESIPCRGRMVPSMKLSATSDPRYFLRFAIRKTFAAYFSITSPSR